MFDWLLLQRGLIMIGCWYQFNREGQAFCNHPHSWSALLYLHVSVSLCPSLSRSSLLSVLLKGISRYSPVPLSLPPCLLEQDPRWMIARAESTCFSRTSDGQWIIKMMSRQEEVSSWPLPSHNHGPPGPLSHPPAPPSSLPGRAALQPCIHVLKSAFAIGQGRVLNVWWRVSLCGVFFPDIYSPFHTSRNGN